MCMVEAEEGLLWGWAWHPSMGQVNSQSLQV